LATCACVAHPNVGVEFLLTHQTLPSIVFRYIKKPTSYQRHYVAVQVILIGIASKAPDNALFDLCRTKKIFSGYDEWMGSMNGRRLLSFVVTVLLNATPE